MPTTFYELPKWLAVEQEKMLKNKDRRVYEASTYMPMVAREIKHMEPIEQCYFAEDFAKNCKKIGYSDNTDLLAKIVKVFIDLKDSDKWKHHFEIQSSAEYKHR